MADDQGAMVSLDRLPHARRLTPSSSQVYKHAAGIGVCPRPAEAAAQLGIATDEAERAIEHLIDLKLLRPDPCDADRLVPISPDTAATVLVAEEQAALIRQHQALEAVRADFQALMPTYIENARNNQQEQNLEILPTAEEARSALTGLIAGDAREVLSIQRGGARDARLLETKLPHDLAALRSGTGIRLLYQHTVRAHLPTYSYIGKITKAGALVRTTDQLQICTVILDRRTAFLPIGGHEDWSSGAVLIREPTIVHFLIQTFEQAWSAATPVRAEILGYRDIDDDIKLSIAKLLAEGHTDEVVARRMGMGVRTCRRHIAELMDELGVKSRFQAGVAAAHRGLISNHS
ncbi:helix-turn-helix transcriptional regulator [Actinoallomurus sp. NBC_01490]|uniref:helix-turn-helix transcriptional regulator n=1 Tax=Actinoallomurus sp. NBC_01490 TaxID=2903557 RepID=UPI002E37B3C1|nr:helix-turn-helix transcriptional regulator [Actinoallomurus sp. NBC_01490]